MQRLSLDVESKEKNSSSPIGRAFEDAADSTINAADEHPRDSPCVPYSTVMAMLYQLEWQAKRAEKEIFKTLGKQQ